MDIFKFLKLQVKNAYAVLIPSSAGLERISAPWASSTTKHEIDSKLRKPTNLLSVFAYYICIRKLSS